MFASLYTAMSIMDGVSAQVTTASALGALCVLVYRSGMLRQEMKDVTKTFSAQLDSVRADLERFCEETNRRFDAISRRFDAIDRFIAAATEQRVATERWQARVETMLELHERQIYGLTSLNASELS